MSGLTVNLSHGGIEVHGTLTTARLRCTAIVDWDQDYDQAVLCRQTTDPLDPDSMPCGHVGRVERVMFGMTDDGQPIEVTYDDFDPTDQWSVLVASLA